ncbi:MAG: VacJ family lipoprotein [Deltaproteobacteria bacterium]|nr:VacJ family lipoprotein [Deltaproteobacteria bacterium]
MGLISRALVLLSFFMVLIPLPYMAESWASQGYYEIMEDFPGRHETNPFEKKKSFWDRLRWVEVSDETGGSSSPEESKAPRKESADLKDGSEVLEEEEDVIADPLEPVNRVIFHFNDKFYFWVLEPVAEGYAFLVPEKLRVCVRNFFDNLLMPVRAVNCLLQGKVKGFGTEVARFAINSTMGIGGFGDAGKIVFNLEPRLEDFGQTLGFYGIGPGIYIDLPFIGSSSIRDSMGLMGDSLFNPLNYIGIPIEYNSALKAYSWMNYTSLFLGEYESFKKAAFDPYISLRNAYYEYRKYMIAK